ncbi:aspartate/glutamate racemase family protein [Chitinophaga sp. RAB17]|uniref:aspartate/glutamate racemase family protein n=1 Tax=Chitinophaga sp. RAB17 TaxID=3233049 RepID=UPI003F9349BF
MGNMKENNVIGIVGGMGPQAGVALFERVLYHTNALSDQQHLSTILMSFPSHIVDRTSFLEGHEPVNPAFNIAKVINRLEMAGAGVIGIACNTAHCSRIYDVILDELHKTNSPIKLVNMISEVCRRIEEHYPRARRIGVMATDGTYKSGVYQELLQKCGLEAIMPDPAFQHTVIHRMIYDPDFGIKAHSVKISPKVNALLKKALQFFRREAVDAIVLGCTELSLILQEEELENIPVIDSSKSLALALIREATAEKTANKIPESTSNLNENSSKFLV